MSKIFISYSRNDETFARQVAVALANLGADIWIDVEDIPVGMKWSTAIQQGLDTANALVVIITPDSMASGNVEDEWQYFLDRGKPVIPILLREAKIPFQLNRVQWIDFKNQPFEFAMVGLHAEFARFGIHLEAPPHPPGYVAPLSHGHSRMPEPQAVPQKRTALYAGGALVAILIVVAILAFVLNADAIFGSPTETATHSLETQIILDLTAAAGLPDLTATYEAVATNIVAGITQTKAAEEAQVSDELTANAPTNTATSSPTMTSSPTYTPDVTQTREAILAAEEEASRIAQLAIDEQETQNAQARENAPTNTPQPTATLTATATVVPSDTPIPTATLPPTATATTTPDADATSTAEFVANQTVEAQIAETAQALTVRIELGRVSIADALNIRSNPNTSAQIVTSVAPDVVLEVIGRNDDASWINVRTPDDDDGWVDANFFEILGLYPESKFAEVAEILRYIRENDDFEPIIHEFDGVPMVLVPSGCFTMGTSDEQVERLSSLDEEMNVDDEQDPQTQCFSFPFWIDQFEVSQEQFAAFDSSAGNDPAFTGMDLPQDSVTWSEALEHCQARNAILPSEAQWEYAARGPDSLLFPWGNTFELDLNWGDSAGTVSVAEYPDGSSWVGAYQMAGNVWEWTISPYLAYPTGADYRLDDVNGLRVLRGGSFVDGLRSNMRSANRLSSRPDTVRNYYGFRCVRVENIIP